MQTLKSILFSAVLLGVVAINNAQARPTLLEIFTSEGCSSCPPAEKKISELNTRKDVFALSFHVDYWDYIGWKDPFASPDNTQRQRAYRRTFDANNIYTPQVVIDGADETVGSWGWRIKMLMHSAQENQVDIPISLTKVKDGKLRIVLPQHALKKPADILVVIYLPQTQSDVKRGENKGLHLQHTNVVTRFFKAASWQGQKTNFTFSPHLQKNEKVAVILQEKAAGKILGLTLLP